MAIDGIFVYCFACFSGIRKFTQILLTLLHVRLFTFQLCPLIVTIVAAVDSYTIFSRTHSHLNAQSINVSGRRRRRRLRRRPPSRKEQMSILSFFGFVGALSVSQFESNIWMCDSQASYAHISFGHLACVAFCIVLSRVCVCFFFIHSVACVPLTDSHRIQK